MSLADILQVLRNLDKIEVEFVTLLLWAHFNDNPFSLRQIDLRIKEAKLKELLGDMVKQGLMLRMGASWMITTSGHAKARGVLVWFL